MKYYLARNRVYHCGTRFIYKYSALVVTKFIPIVISLTCSSKTSRLLIVSMASPGYRGCLISTTKKLFSPINLEITKYGQVLPFELLNSAFGCYNAVVYIYLLFSHNSFIYKQAFLILCLKYFGEHFLPISDRNVPNRSS